MKLKKKMGVCEVRQKSGLRRNTWPLGKKMWFCCAFGELKYVL